MGLHWRYLSWRAMTELLVVQWKKQSDHDVRLSQFCCLICEIRVLYIQIPIFSHFVSFEISLLQFALFYTTATYFRIRCKNQPRAKILGPHRFAIIENREMYYYGCQQVTLIRIKITISNSMRCFGTIGLR